MIDIHAHLLPGVDDGPENWEETLSMLQTGVMDGISGVVCTSHVVDYLSKELENEFKEKFQQLKKTVKRERMGISLWLGSEMHYYASYNHRSKVATLNGNGKYILLELPFIEIPNDVGETIFQIALKGRIPIIAHPERNLTIIRKPELLYELVQRGALLQINAGSLTGGFGRNIKRLATQLFDHQMVHFVASDCHSPRSRPMILSKAYGAISKRWGEDRAEQVLRINPHKAIMGEKIYPPEPIPFDERIRRRRGRFHFPFFRHSSTG
ncbi:hypothetical protein JW824_11320 [bacterium]|nr:hypothetical protein [bacterium]RQV92218.1 MAG: hypothetical protein EH221_11940 [bacterium]